MLDKFLFVGYPYAALVLAVVVGILRYRWRPFSYSSLSSQFLENKQLFWGSGLWHWGILWVLAGHFVAFLIPGRILAWNAQPVRLYLLEASGLIMGLLAMVGVVALMVRRSSSARIKAVTSPMDWVILCLLLLQVVTGVDTALRYRWGSSWYASNAVPYLRSILALNPRPEFIQPLPWFPKLHILGGLTILLLIPFSRLAHFLVVPLHYLWRKPQVVIWNRRGLR